MDPFIQYGLIAGIQAIDDSGLQITDSNRHRIGAAIGSGIGGMGSIENTRDLINGVDQKEYFFCSGFHHKYVAGNLSIKYGFQGPNLSVAACTTELIMLA